VNFIPKKSLGQNFLINQSIINRILDVCNLKDTDIVLEIGPGQGALTYDLIDRVKEFYCIEIDKRLAQNIQDRTVDKNNIDIIQTDFLKFSIDKSLPQEEIKVISNLPYNSATAILEKLLMFRKKWSAIYVMVQLEHAQRMLAVPRTKKYGAFSCFMQYYSDMKILFKIPKSAFKPMPKVESCFMEILPKKELDIKVNDEKVFWRVIKQAFQQRRKTLINSLSGVYDKVELIGVCDKLKIPLNARAEELNLKCFAGLADGLMVKKN